MASEGAERPVASPDERRCYGCGVPLDMLTAWSSSKTGRWLDFHDAGCAQSFECGMAERASASVSNGDQADTNLDEAREEIAMWMPEDMSARHPARKARSPATSSDRVRGMLVAPRN